MTTNTTSNLKFVADSNDLNSGNSGVSFSPTDYYVDSNGNYYSNDYTDKCNNSDKCNKVIGDRLIADLKAF